MFQNGNSKRENLLRPTLIGLSGVFSWGYLIWKESEKLPYSLSVLAGIVLIVAILDFTWKVVLYVQRWIRRRRSTSMRKVKDQAISEELNVLMDNAAELLSGGFVWCLPEVLRNLQNYSAQDADLQEKYRVIGMQVRILSGWQKLYSTVLRNTERCSNGLSVPQLLWLLVEFQDRVDDTIELYNGLADKYISSQERPTNEDPKYRYRYNEYVSNLENLIDKARQIYGGEMPDRKTYHRIWDIDNP